MLCILDGSDGNRGAVLIAFGSFFGSPSQCGWNVEHVECDEVGLISDAWFGFL